MKRAIVTAGMIVSFAACQQDRIAGPENLGPPECTQVTGTGGVTFTTNEGASLTPTNGVLAGVKYTRGLVALSGSTLLAAHGGKILRSTDAGCTWTQVSTVPSAYVALVAASPTLAYGYADGPGGLYRVPADGAVQVLSSPVPRVRGLAVRAGHPESIRVAGETGQIFESNDHGATWKSVGTPVQADWVFSVAFDPADWNVAFAGTPHTGAWRTENGGLTWSRAHVSSPTAQRKQNVFKLEVSPVDPRTVWAAGLDLAERDLHGTEARYIYLSRDRGHTFTPVLSETPGSAVNIINGPVMAAHPRDPLVLYFVFSSSFRNYGTDIIRLDARTGTHTRTHNAYHDVSEIAFAPGRPDVMYLGVGIEQICDPLPCSLAPR
ncbi:MAG TPA: hypothetical protein VGB66_06740 [Longimicrobium sp.]|jgi:hypothetical protein